MPGIYVQVQSTKLLPGSSYEAHTRQGTCGVKHFPEWSDLAFRHHNNGKPHLECLMPHIAARRFCPLYPEAFGGSFEVSVELCRPLRSPPRSAAARETDRALDYRYTSSLNNYLGDLQRQKQCCVLEQIKFLVCFVFPKASMSHPLAMARAPTEPAYQQCRVQKIRINSKHALILIPGILEIKKKNMSY